MTGARPRLAVVGAGQMGSQHARVVARTDHADLAFVVDTDAERGRAAAEQYGAEWRPQVDDVLPRVDAVVVATPTERHLSTAMAAIDAGLPVLVEKPVAERLDDVRSLLAAAERRDSPFMCGFVERHNPAVATALGLIDGPIRHAVSIRHSPPAPRIRTSVVWDLLVHDLDLAWRMTGGCVERVAATGFRVGGTLEVADAVVSLRSGSAVTLSSSRASQRKVRSWTIAADDVMVEVDLVRQDVTSYRHVTHSAGANVGYRAETVVDIPFVRHGGEPLELQLQHFVRLVRGDADAAAERDSILPAHELASEVESLLAASHP